MSESPAVYTILVADIVGSTELYDLLGDQKAQRIVANCMRNLDRLVASHGGAVAATVGDEIVCVFEDAAMAATASCEMHLGNQNDVTSENLWERALQLSIGLHQGVVQASPLDMTSDTVTIARHLSSLAKADQTLTTKETVDEFPRIHQALSRHLDDEPFRGTSGQIRLRLYELIWEVDGMTAHASTHAAQSSGRYDELLLRYAGEEHKVNDDKAYVAVGRSNDNEIVVDFDHASREHFRLALRRGRCVLTDVSTNGTCIVNSEGGELLIIRESLPLKGSGKIYFGIPNEENESHAIEFWCR